MSLGFTAIVWPLFTGMCLAIGLIHCIIWLKRPRDYVHLVMSAIALSIAALIVSEWLLLHARTAAEFGEIQRWMQVPVFIFFIAAVLFVRKYLQAGRLWLGIVVCGLRLLTLIINLLHDPNLQYASIDRLQFVQLWDGETVAMAVGVHSKWWLLSQLSSLMLLIYVADATLTVWRRAQRYERTRVIAVGGSFILTLLIVLISSLLMPGSSFVQPFYLFPSYLAVVVVSSFALGNDVIRATRLGEELETTNVQLRKSQEQVDLISGAAAVGMWEWDSRRDTIWVTEQTRALYGFGANEPINFARFLNAVYAEDRAAVRESALQSVQDGQRFQREYRVVRADGSVGWILTRGRVEAGGAGAPRLLCGISLDVSERRQREELLQKERAFLRQVIDVNRNFIFAKDRAGRYTLANRATANVYGTTVDDLLGKTDADFNSNVAEVERFLKQDKEVMDTLQECFIPEEQVTDAAGRVRWLQTCRQPIVNPDGSADQMLGTSTDITERKQAELDLVQQRNELAHLSRVMMLSELSGSLAHELNQPLAAILSNAQAALRFLAQDAPNLDEIREILRDIVADDKRAGEVIQGLRAMLKKGQLRYEPVDPNALVLDVVRLLRSDMLNASVIYTTELAPQLPNISGIYVQLQQVLLNLMVNACDAMADVEVAKRHLTVRTTHDGGDRVTFRVCDRGHGIPVGDVTQVFQPFFTTKAHGLGLGLAVCRRLIDAHGGKMWATNNIGDGASFCFSVPIAEKHATLV